MRRGIFLFSSVAVLPLALSCDSDDQAGPDGGIDECIGHGCPESPIDLPEGGEVRLEMVHTDRWAPEVRTYAWFADEQVPDERPWPRPPENWYTQDGPDLCTDLRDGSFFPSGEVESRSYLDVGESVTFSGVSNDSEITLNRRFDEQDNAVWLWHDILYIDQVSPDELVQGSDYDFHISGSDDFPDTTYESAVRVPPDFEPEFPNMDSTVFIERGSDFRFLTGTQSDNEYDFNFVGFRDGYGPVGWCVGPQSEYMTIPEEFLDRMPDGGFVQYGLLNHRVEEREGRRIDFVGINCREARYVLSEGEGG